MKRIAVIGGGASGMVAAIHAAKAGAKVVLFEKQNKLGRKLLATGNGRCNITNANIEVPRYHGHNPDFVRHVFSRFGLDHTIEFFRSIGIPIIEKEKGRLFPASLQASTVVNILAYEAEKAGAEIRLHRRIDSIEPRKGGFTLVTAGMEKHIFDSVILSAGSCAYPPLGASSIGYDLASALGHTVYEPFPSILPLNIPEKPLHRLQGIKWDCRVRVLSGGKVKAESEEEVLFTSYGISGPASLDVSRAVNELTLHNNSPEISIDLFPGYTEHDLADICAGLWDHGDKTAAFSLQGILPLRMPEMICETAGIDPKKKAGNLSRDERLRVIAALKVLKLKPGKPRGFAEAVVAAGGVDVDEIDGATMESRKMKGIHITGELLDIDGDSGGYNLQFAWSTGALAGLAQA